MWAIVLIGLESAAFLGISLAITRQRLRKWLAAAESCGLIVEEISGAWSWWPTLKARRDRLEVGIESARSRDHGTRVVVVVPGPPGFAGVRIRREESRPPGAREIEIGDEGFDDTFFVEGPIRLLCALLNSETRSRLRQLNAQCRLEIGGGEVRAEAVVDDQLPSLLGPLLQVASRIAEPLEVLQCLILNAQQDPMPGVRLRNLLLVARELRGDPGTIEMLRASCSDKSPEVRLRAAMELGAEGRAVLMALAENLEDDSSSAAAISLLRRELPIELTRATLIRALRGRHIQTAHACLEALGRNGTAPAVEILARVMAREKKELAHSAAVALGATGSAAAEPSLILALQRDSADLRVAAANALARLGSPAAVLPLKETARRFPTDSALERATRQAIAEIQSRVKGATPGQLSLAGAEVGQLSLAQAEAGQLSLATEQAGQLSLASKEPGQLPLSGAEEELKPPQEA